MKNKLLIIVFLMTLILTIIFYIWSGSRGLFFRLSMSIILLEIIYFIYNFRKYISYKLQRGKNARIKIFEGFTILFFGIALMILIDSFDITFDWTSRGLFNISPETKRILIKIEKPLIIKLFNYPESTDGIQAVNIYAKKLAQRYKNINPKKIGFEIINPIRDKIIAEKYNIKQNGTLVFEMGDQREYILPNLLIEKSGEFGINYKGETVFTAVISKLLENKKTIIYYLSGHGEIDFNSGGAVGYNKIKQILTDRQYEMNAINLNHYPEIPENTDILIIADPKVPLSIQTYQSIKEYLKNDGAILYLVGPDTVELNYLFMKSGFVYIPNIAIDPSLTSKNEGKLSIIPLLSPVSEITTRLRHKNLSVLFPSASIVGKVPEKSINTNLIYDINILAKTSKYGFGERSFNTGYFKKDDRDIVDIYDLALSSIVADKNDPEKQRRAAIFGSLDFIDNSRVNRGGNSQLFLNTIDFLLRKDLKLSIPSKIENLQLSIPRPKDSRTITVLLLVWNLILIIMSFTILLVRYNKVKK